MVSILLDSWMNLKHSLYIKYLYLLKQKSKSPFFGVGFSSFIFIQIPIIISFKLWLLFTLSSKSFKSSFKAINLWFWLIVKNPLLYSSSSSLFSLLFFSILGNLYFELIKYLFKLVLLKDKFLICLNSKLMLGYNVYILIAKLFVFWFL